MDSNTLLLLTVIQCGGWGRYRGDAGERGTGGEAVDKADPADAALTGRGLQIQEHSQLQGNVQKLE